MTDQMHLAGLTTDQAQRAFGFVVEREGMSPAPGTGAVVAVVLRGLQIEASAQNFGEMRPLASSTARAMEGDHAFARRALRQTCKCR
jgi:hypothetical protein